jgi:drug/metabolite transporter (DMT)-like permease
MNEQAKGFAFIILAMLIFGLNGIFIRYIPLSSVAILLFFQIFGFAGLFLILLFRRKYFRAKLMKFLFALAIVAVANDLFYFTAFRLTTISNTILTHYTAPIFVAILAPLLIKERLERNSIIALILSFIGLLLIVYPNLSVATSLLGIMLGTLSGVFYALLIIIYKHLLKSIHVYTMMFYRYLLSAVILSPVIFTEKIELTGATPVLLIAFGLLFPITAALMHAEGVKRVKAQHAGIMGYSEPVGGAIYAFLFFSEVPGVATLLGGALIVLGGYLVIRSQK